MHTDEKEFYGITTIGEKGQAVIPSNVRKKLSLKKGDKLLVFGAGKEMVMLVKASNLEKFVKHLNHKMESLQKIIKKVH